MKKALAFALLTVCVGGTFAGCKKDTYKGDELDGYVSQATVSSNGGFAVEKGDYVYFINAKENNGVNNKYGEVVKGALMRISKADLAAGKNDNVKTVVPSLFVAQNMDAGIYIYGDYVYYATPTTDKNLSGNVEYTYIDFKRARLDGTEAPENYFFRLSDNTANYRFVQENDVVYCLFEEGTSLKSYNVSTGKTTVLVNGASDYFYDATNAENPKVYYTMDVSFRMDSDNAIAADYNQLYAVSASATATVDKSKASYTVYNGDKAVKTYDFDENYLKEKNDEAKDNDEDEPYDLGDYSTYPYVNLGTLVLDGIGKINTDENVDNRFVWNGEESDRVESGGYKYTVNGYRGGGVYFTRAAVSTTQSDGVDAKLYCLPDANVTAEWNTVSENKGENFETVALNTTNTGSALFHKEGEKYYYFYAVEKVMYRAGFDNATNAKIEPMELFTMKGGEETLTPWTVNGEYLYFFSGTGSSISRVKWNGEEKDGVNPYNELLANNADYAEYQVVTLPAVNYNSAWYKPEIIGDTVLYAGAQTFGDGGSGYDYIYTAKLGTSAQIAERAKAYKAVEEYLNDMSSETDKHDALNYYFRTAERTLFDQVADKFDEDVKEAFEEFVKKFGDDGEFKGAFEKDFITLIGKMTSADKEAIQTSWANYLYTETAVEEESGLPTWAIVLIVCGSVAVVAVAVLVPLLIVLHKKKLKAKEAEATVNAYKRKKIDTTDDKTIDVYADEETPVEETPAEEVPAEEVPVEETPVTKTVEENVETPAEEVTTEEPPVTETVETDEESKDE